MDTALFLTIALCFLSPSSLTLELGVKPQPLLVDSEIPFKFPKEGAKKASEVPDLLITQSPDTDDVEHPNVVDPGKTHEEGVMQSNNSDTVHTCTFPRAWLKDGNDSIPEEWLSDGDNGTNTCSITRDWLRENNNGTIHICSISHEWLKNGNYTIHNGTIPREWLRENNSTNVNCITPTDNLSNNDNGTIANGTIPSAWLKDSKDNIYIYFIPSDWLRTSNASSDVNETQNINYTTDEEIETGPRTSVTEDKQITTTTNITSTTSPIFNNTTTSGVASNITNSTNSKILNNANSITNTTTVNITDVAITTIDDVNDKSNGTNQTTIITTTALSKSNDTKVSTSSTAPTPNDPKTDVSVPEVSMIPFNKDNTNEASSKASVEVNNSDIGKGRIGVPSVTEILSTPVDLVGNDLGNGEGTTPQSPVALSQQHADHSHNSGGKTAFLQPTESAAILAGVFVGIALLGYVGLLLWRRVLERRYGNREMLVNEDDDFDTSDTRHFEMT